MCEDMSGPGGGNCDSVYLAHKIKQTIGLGLNHPLALTGVSKETIQLKKYEWNG